MQVSNLTVISPFFCVVFSEDPYRLEIKVAIESTDAEESQSMLYAYYLVIDHVTIT